MKSDGWMPRRAASVGAALLLTLSACVAPLITSTGAAAADAAPAPRFLGPVLGSDETATLSLGRDAGFSVPLPNGRDLWIFGDTPVHKYQDGA